MPNTSTRVQEIRSQLAQDVLSRPPAWLVRFGTGLLGITVILLIFLAWLIRYPDIIAAPVRLTTATPPAPIIARASGELKLQVSDQQWVEPGQLLAMIDHPAGLNTVLWLEALLNDLSSTISQLSFQTPPAPTQPFEPLITHTVDVGPLQGHYEAFLESIKRYQTLNSDRFTMDNLALLAQQKAHYQALDKQLDSAIALQNTQVSLSESRYKAEKALVARQLLASSILLELESERLNHHQELSQLKQAQIKNRIDIASIDQRLITEHQSLAKTQKTVLINLNKQFHLLKGAIRTFKAQYYLTAPMAGYVNFFHYWSNHQVVNQGDEIMTLIPESTQENPQAILGQSYVKRQGTGRLNPGQAVNIKLDRYPFREFGMIQGIVTAISPLARQDSYLIQISLPQGLTTNYGQTLEFRPEMVGQADIITQELRFLERIFYSLRAIFTDLKPTH